MLQSAGGYQFPRWPFIVLQHRRGKKVEVEIALNCIWTSYGPFYSVMAHKNAKGYDFLRMREILNQRVEPFNRPPKS